MSKRNGNRTGHQHRSKAGGAGLTQYDVSLFLDGTTIHETVWVRGDDPRAAERAAKNQFSQRTRQAILEATTVVQAVPRGSAPAARGMMIQPRQGGRVSALSQPQERMEFSTAGSRRQAAIETDLGRPLSKSEQTLLTHDAKGDRSLGDGIHESVEAYADGTLSDTAVLDDGRAVQDVVDGHEPVSGPAYTGSADVVLMGLVDGPLTHVMQEGDHANLAWCGVRKQFRHADWEGTYDQVTCTRCKAAVASGHGRAWRS